MLGRKLKLHAAEADGVSSMFLPFRDLVVDVLEIFLPLGDSCSSYARIA